MLFLKHSVEPFAQSHRQKIQNRSDTARTWQSLSRDKLPLNEKFQFALPVTVPQLQTERALGDCAVTPVEVGCETVFESAEQVRLAEGKEVRLA